MAVTTTAQKIIVGAMKLTGIISQNEQPNAGETQDAFARLNSLVDSWGTQRLTMRVVTREVFDLVADQAEYTLGPSGDWDTVRPTSIDSLALLLTDSDPDVEIPLGLYTEAAWQAQAVKAQTNTLPTQAYVEWTEPQATVTLWPVPTDAANQIVVYAPLVVPQFPTLTTSVVLAPGYERALRYTLAVDLAPEFGAPLRPDVVVAQRQAIADIKAMNVPMADLGMDLGLVAGPNRYGFNIQTGP